MKVIELVINPDVALSGGDTIALVEIPAIEQDFMAFSQETSKGNNVFLISCSALKKEGKMPAKELYDSPLFKKSLDFSIKKAKSEDFVKIISAKYGLVDLNQVIENYDMTLKDFSSDQQKAWANKVFEQIKSKFNINKDKFVFLAGDAYTKYLAPMFKYKSNFLEGKRLGERMQYLNQFSMEFIVLTNDESYAHQFSFSRTDISEEEYILEQLLMLEFSESLGEISTNSTELPQYATYNSFAQELQEKRRIIGPVMTPDKLIPRVDEDGTEYQVFFTADTIEKIAYKYMKDSNLHNVNIEHNGEEQVDDAWMVESWLVEDPEKDKSTLYGFSPVKGQWFTIYQLGPKTWEQFVKTDKVKGLSLEGYFYEQLRKK